MVRDNPYLKQLDFFELFFRSAFGEPFSPSKFYRPIQLVSFWFDYNVFGLNAVGFRVMSFFYGSLLGIIVFHCFKKLHFQSFISCCLTLLFLLHPLQIEAITYISGRGDLLYMVFCLGAFLLFLKPKFSYRRASLIFLLIIAAFLTKENSVVFPVILFGYAWLFLKKRQQYFSMGLVLIALSYSAIRLFLPASDGVLSWIAAASFFERICTVPYILVTYLKLSFFPFPLHMEYHNVISTFFSVHFFVLLVLLLLLAVPVLFVVQKKLYVFAIGWFFCCLIPVLQVVVGLASTVREHWASLALFGLVLGLGLGVQQIPKRFYYHRGVVLVCMIVLLAGVTIHRNQFWLSEQTLYENDLRYEPRSFVMLNNLGRLYYEQGQIDLAKMYFLKAVYRSPNHVYDVALNNVGAVYLSQGNQALAELYFKQSIRYGQYLLAYQNLLSLYKQQGRLAEYNDLKQTYQQLQK